MKPNPDNPVLQRFATSLARRPYCKDVKDGPMLIEDRVDALRCPYVQLNGRLVRYLVLDIDRRDAPAAWIDAGLPAPTIIVRTPRTNRAHLLYELATPVSVGGDARPKPRRFMEDVWDRMEVSLGGDPSYNRMLVKNPLHSTWDIIVNDVAYELCKLADFVRHIKLPPRSSLPAVALEGRNCTLFHTLRRWAPTAISAHDAYNSWLTAVNKRAHGINGEFESPLTRSEVQSVARSVARYLWDGRDRDRGRGPRRRWRTGKLGLAPISVHLGPAARSKAKKERHAVGGRTVSATRRSTTEDRIVCAIAEMTTEFRHARIVDVAERLGLSREQVSRKYGHLFRKPYKNRDECYDHVRV
jgi:hypothetical protein